MNIFRELQIRITGIVIVAMLNLILLGVGHVDRVGASEQERADTTTQPRTEQVAARGEGEAVGRITTEEAELAEYVEDLAYQDINTFWAENFANLNEAFEGSATEYTPPELVVVIDKPVETPCVKATAEEAMFYCGLDNTIYYGLDLELAMAEQFGPFDFANALAHEWGHHLQNQMGYLEDKDETNDVAFENQADCFAGVWAASFEDLTEEDFLLALEAQAALGDEKSEEEGKHHGSPEERVEWFKYGFETGDPTQCTTF